MTTNLQKNTPKAHSTDTQSDDVKGILLDEMGEKLHLKREMGEWWGNEDVFSGK